jgi:DNA-binding CsgD family transcriptional regulator
MGLLMASLVVLELSYRHPATPLARAQLAWIRWGLSIGVAATVLHRLAILASKDAMPAGVGTIVAAVWIVFPVALAFAVLRYRLFEVDRVVRASITWGVLAGLLLTSYLALVVVVGRIATSVIGPAASDNPTAAVIAALFVAAMAHPVRVRLQAALDRHVYRHRLARGRFLARAADLLGQSQTPTTVANFLCQSVTEELNVSNGWLAVSKNCAPLFEAEPGVLLPNVSIAAPSLVECMHLAMLPVLLARAEDIDVYTSVPAISGEQPGVAPWYRAGARALVPIRSASDGALLALWALGAPASGDLFDPDDLDAFNRVGRMAGLQIERAVLQGSRPMWAASRPPTAALAAVSGSAFAPTSRRDTTPARLTARETEVLALLARGYTNQRIAEELVIGVRTVETHVEHILRKLHVDSRADAMVWAREQAAR